MEAIILAGGMGTRLREVVSDVPKPMAPVSGKPFLYFILEWLSKFPVNKIILSVGFQSQKIVDFFGDSFTNIPIEYVIEEKPLGTGGAIKFALQNTTGNDVLVLNGDTYFPIDLNNLYSFHYGNQNLFSVALKRMKDFSRYGSVEQQGNTILRFNEKKFVHDGLINGGIYFINKKFFKSGELPEVFSLESDILAKEAQYSVLKCMEFDDMFLDIGVPEDYYRAEDMIKKS